MPRIINILTHPPSYENYKEGERMAVNWDLPDNQWIGMDGTEFPDLLGIEILKLTDEFIYEVWQPDYKADKIYTHRFPNGLIHRLFPAEEVTKQVGLKKVKETYSSNLVDFLKNLQLEEQVIINLNGNFNYFNFQLLELFQHLPLVQTFRGIMYLPQTQIFKWRKNLPASWTYYNDHKRLSHLIKKVDYITYMNETNLDKLESIYTGSKEKLTSGVDFSFWHALPKQSCRDELDLPKDRFIIFSSSRLIPIKQIDKMLDILLELDKSHDFLLVISGSGDVIYQDYLKKVAAPLLKKDKVRFVGYLFDQELRKYYSASDLFISTSISEGGPVSVMKAMACELPVVNTDVGNTHEIMEQYEAGIILERKNYYQWKLILEEIMNGKKIPALPRKIVQNHYAWSKIAQHFIEIYQQVQNKYAPASKKKSVKQDL